MGMGICVFSIENHSKSWVDEVSLDYTRRLQPPWDLTWVHVKSKKRSKGMCTDSICEQECEKLLQRRRTGSVSIALDRCGKTVSSKQWSVLLDQGLSLGRSIDIFIGGPEGLTRDFIQQCDHVISLSAMTFSHPLVRVLLAEQVYRAWSIVHNHPYHR
jgi:23S rRNA (pseudouridine1915-N3)-methyltransferase